jgi:hypothetical protein
VALALPRGELLAHPPRQRGLGDLLPGDLRPRGERRPDALVVVAVAAGEREADPVSIGGHPLVGEVGGDQGLQRHAQDLLGGAGAVQPLDQVGGAALAVGVADLLLALAGLELADLDVLELRLEVAEPARGVGVRVAVEHEQREQAGDIPGKRGPVEALGELGAEVEVGAARRYLFVAFALAPLAAQLLLGLLVGPVRVGVDARRGERLVATLGLPLGARSRAWRSIRSSWARQRSAMNPGSQMNACEPW